MTTESVVLGATGPKVFPLAFGCMGMSGSYGPTDDDESVKVLQAAMERGVTMFDTGDFYGSGHNEMLLGRAIRGRRDRVLLSVKFGGMRGPDGGWIGLDMRPGAVRNFVAYTLKRLGVDHVDVYRPGRLDPAVPIEDTIGAIARLVEEGFVRHVGLSEVGAETIRRAAKVAPIVDLQIEHSLVSRAPETAIFPTLRELGISATLYGVYSRGLLTGSKPAGKGDFRGFLPRFAGEAGKQNENVVARLRSFAADHGRTPAQVLLGWSRARQPDFVPVIGIKTIAQLDDALAAIAKPLTESESSALEALVPADAIAGTRYAAEQMKHLDSEK
jgi:aryl-alcohol dehydrogenase-like predicted oxidoreductase